MGGGGPAATARLAKIKRSQSSSASWLSRKTTVDRDDGDGSSGVEGERNNNRERECGADEQVGDDDVGVEVVDGVVTETEAGVVGGDVDVGQQEKASDIMKHGGRGRGRNNGGRGGAGAIEEGTSKGQCGDTFVGHRNRQCEERPGLPGQTLEPEQYAPLKQALSALWEADDDRRGRSTAPQSVEAHKDPGTPATASFGGVGDGSEGVEKGNGRETGWAVHGGLKASELSAIVFRNEALRERWEGGECDLGVREGGSDDGVRGFECSVEDLEYILLELEVEAEADGTGER